MATSARQFFLSHQTLKTSKLCSLVLLGSVMSGCVGSNNYLEDIDANVQPTAPQQIEEPAQTPSPATNPGTYQPVPLGNRLPAPTAAQLLQTQDNVQIASNTLEPAQTPQPNAIIAATSVPTPAPTNGLALLPASNSSNTPQALQTLTSLEQSTDGNSLIIGLASAPQIDPAETAAKRRAEQLYRQIKHGKCKGEWGPKPKRLEAKRINPQDPYYIEIRMRNTPLMPVGHTFVVYGKLDANGEPLDERMAMLAPLGGYAGASLAAAIPVPGVLTPYGDDCRIRPETSYRVSLNAQRYEKLLLALQAAKAKRPVYMLFAQNCNHFTQRMADAVGIKPPRNKYVPAVDYLYDMIEANEGKKIDRRFRSKIAGIPDWPTPAYIQRQRAQAANL